jgi:tetratricopeptide (TPR) repeat protein
VQPRGIERLALRLLATCGLVVLALGSGAAPAAASRAVLLAQPDGDAQLGPVPAGYGLWLQRRLQAAGLRVVTDSAGTPAELGTLLRRAASSDADYALAPRLGLRDGRVSVRLLLYAPGSERLLAAPAAEAPLGSIGEACEKSAQALLARLGAGGSAAGVPPLLDELASAGRALIWLRSGELGRAWEEVEGKLSPSVMALRTSLVETARRSGFPEPERARVLAAAGDDRAAWALVTQNLPQGARDAASPALLLAAAEVQLRRGDPRSARSYLEPILARDPDHRDALLALGQALSLQGDVDGARRALERAAHVDPGHPEPLLRLAEVEEGSPPRQARALLEAGRREAGRWNLARADRLLRRAERLDPSLSAETARGRARMSQATGQPARAAAAWRQVASAADDDAEAWRGLGRAQLALGDAEAANSLRRAAELAPRDASGLTELGLAELAAGRPQQAAGALRQATALAPQSETARRGLARALRATGEPEAALEALGAELAAGDAETWRQAGAIQRDLGRLQGARDSLEQAIALEPYDAELHAELAAVRQGLGDAEGAAQSLELAGVLEEALDTGASQPAELAAAADLNLDELVLGFSRQLSGARRRQVAQLGIREPRDPWSLLVQWLHPRTPDLPRLESALSQALGLRFALMEPAHTEDPLHAERLDRLYAFEESTSLDARTIADVNALLGTDAVFVSRLVREPPPVEDPDALAPECADPGHFELETRMLLGRHPELASILLDVECLPQGMQRLARWNERALALYGLLALLLCFPLLRGWGRLVVEIKLPPRTRGFLHIKIGRKPEEAGGEQSRRKRPDGGGRLRRSLRSLSRYHKHMAGRETAFRWIPARRREYFVTVRGPLFDAMGAEQIGHFLEEQRVRVQRGRTARLTYDFNPSECALQVNVYWNGEPARSARVALRDVPDSLRYARDGRAFFYVGKGSHTVLVGAVDRATERGVEVRSVENALQVDLDLGSEEGLMVRGSAEAVEPYLLGDFASAAEALRAAGEEQLAHLMQGAHHQQQGDPEAAAREFEAAGCIEEAAELRASHADHRGSAALFEQAGEFARAAEAHRASGDLADAGRCYEAAYDYDNAVECYEAAGLTEKVIELREKQGAYLDAAVLAWEQGLADRALENLQAVERRDPAYGEACRLSAEILVDRGDFGAAAERLEQAIEVAGGDAASPELHEQYGRALEQAGDKQRALEVFEAVRRRDPRRAGLGTHIEALRQEVERSAAPTRVGSGPAQTESRYELLAEIGRGGMGVVYKARDRRLNRIVALKRLPDDLRDNATAAQLFLREAQAAAALNHRNIVTLYDAGEENGVYHITMELLEGLPLNAIQERRGALRPGDVARLGIQTCAGLDYAHRQRIVHRDIKTANLFFTSDKVVKIMDFGLAKTIEEVRKGSTVIGGTPYYMAPEQAAGETVDHRTDLYALGVTLYRLLTGTFPFVEGDLAYHHRHTPPPDPREHVPTLPEPLAELILALLEKSPQARPASAGEVGARLQQVHKASG